MEPSEDTSLEAAIGWLVQTILSTLQIDKLNAWIQRVNVADDVNKLKSEIKIVWMVVFNVKGRAIGNKMLSESLAVLKELLYDADDVVDDLDCYRLQQENQEVTMDEPAGMRGAEQVDETSTGDADNADTPDSSVSKLWSGVWEHFTITERDQEMPVKAKCRICGSKFACRTDKNGTSSMKKHLKNRHGIEISKKKLGANPPNTSSRKRKKPDEETAETTAANAHPLWDKTELSSRIQNITSQLHDTRVEVSGFLKILGPDSVASSNHCPSDQRLRTSSVVQRKLYGRAEETESIMKLVKEHKSGGLTVLPIVGIAGIGKTALAQHVYSDPTVESQFHHRIWVWVSENFDEVRLTKEMLDFVSRERHDGSPKGNGRHEGISSFAKLQEILKEHMEDQSKRFLLVLDDVWDNLDNYRWNKLLAPFISSHVKGNAILVTTRNFSVAQRVGTLEPVKLGALENDDFWLLFKSHAFGDQNHEGHESLSIIGQQIAEKLNGNPLAAESAGELLRKKLETDHWSNILKNEEWKSLQLSTGIMPALKRSYDQLPYHLQQCFSCPSIFPDSYLFLAEELVHFWISQGFVKSSHSSMRLEEIALCYLTDLVNLSFFQQVEQGSQTCYAMCGLLHDFARMVSWTECATIDGLQCNKLSLTIRHLSIVTDSAYSEDQHGNIPRNQDFEENLRNKVTSMRKLRTLVLIGQYDSFFSQSFQNLCEDAQNLRLLQMSATADDCSVLLDYAKPTAHLRYLKLELSNMRTSTEVSVPSMEELRLQDMQKLERCSCTSVGGLNSSVWTLHIEECYALKVFDLFQNDHKMYLTQLPFDEGENSQSNLISAPEDLSSTLTCSAPDGLLGIPLNPMSSLKEITIVHCPRLTLTQLPVDDGENSQSNLISAPEAAFSALTSSAPNGLLGIPMNHISSLKEITIMFCPRLTFNLSKKGFSGFNSLEKLTIWLCPKLLSSLVHKDENDDRANGRWLLPQSLGQLDISGDSPEMLQPCFLENLTRLTKLSVSYNRSLESLRLQSCTALEDLEIHHCDSLVTLEGLQSLGSLTHLKLNSCLSLHPCLERLSMQGFELCPQLPLLETLHIDYDGCLLTTSFCKHLSSLQYLELSGWHSDTTRLTDDQEMALLLLASLQELRFFRCGKLVDLPAGLKSLTSLKRLEIHSCKGISGLQETGLPASLQDLRLLYCEKLIDLPGGLNSLSSLKRLQIHWCNRISNLPEMGLPGSLEELDIYNCSQAFVRECSKLATSKLKVRIDWEYIN